MLYSKIMVPFDGSDHAKDALAYAKGLLALDAEATLVVVQAVPSGVMGFDGSMSDGMSFGQFTYDQYKTLVDQALAAAKAKMDEELGDLLADVAGRAEAVVVASPTSVTDALAKYAEENGCDLIVMGRRGLGAIRGMLGSVSFGLLRETEIPVLAVK